MSKSIQIERIDNRENVFLLEGWSEAEQVNVKILSAGEDLVQELNEMLNRIGGEPTRASLRAESIRERVEPQATRPLSLDRYDYAPYGLGAIRTVNTNTI